MKRVFAFGALVLTAVLIGCGGADKVTPPSRQQAAAQAIPDSFFLKEEPAGALTVADAKKTAKQGEKIAVTGVVRGQKTAFSAQRAVFTIADATVPLCPMYPDRPWDLHCESPADLAKTVITVEVNGDDGKPLKQSVQGAGGLDHLNKVVVSGTVKEMDAAGNLIIAANGIFVGKKVEVKK